MRKRVTVSMKDDINKKLRILQGEKIKKSPSTISFSDVVNDVLRKSLKS